MSFQERILAAQRRIVDRLVEWEELIGQLYAVYARRFREKRALFEEMASEEREHAAALREIRALLDEGHLLENIGEFNGARVDEEIALVRKALERAERPSVRLQDAVALAREIESSVIESQFYDVVRCPAPQFDALVERLRGGTQGHLERLRGLRT